MNLLDLVAKISLDSSEYENGLKGASGKVTKFGKLSSVAFGAFMEVGRKAANTVFSAISSSMDGAINRFDTLNNFSKVMESIGFEAEDADKAINGLADGIAKLPTTLDAVASETQQLVPVTGDIEKAKDLTLALNNALAAGGVAGAEAQGAIEQWTQAMAKGKPDFTEWMRLVQSAPAQMDQLSKAMLGADATQNDLYNAMKNGSVSMEEVNDKMIELTNASEGFDIAGKHYENWAKQAENASAGIQMSMINIKAAMSRNLANIMDSFDMFLKHGDETAAGIAKKMEGVIPVIDKLGSTISSMLSGDISFEGGITSLINSFGAGAREAIHVGSDIVTNIMSGLAESAPSLIEQASVMISNLGYAFSNEIPNLLSTGASLIGGLVEGFSSGLPSLVSGLASMFTSLTESVDANAAGFISKGLDILTGFSENIRAGAGTLVDAGLTLITHLAQGIASALPELIAKLPTIVTNIAGVINDNAPKVLGAGIKILVTLGQGIIQAIPTLVANLPQIIDAIWNVFTAVNWLALGSQVITAIGNGITALGEALPGALRSIGQKAMNAFKGVSWGSVGKTAISLIGKAISALASLPGAALRKAASLGMKAFTSVSWGNVGSNIVRGIVRGVTAGAGMLVSSLKSLAKRALNAAKSALGIASPSKVFRDQIGKNIGLGMAVGIERSEKSVTSAMDELNSGLEAPIIDPKVISPSIETASFAQGQSLAPATGSSAIGHNVQITNYITVEGAESPEDFANRLVRQMQLDMRMV